MKGMSEQVIKMKKGMTQELGARSYGKGEKNERMESEIEEQRNEMEAKLESESKLKWEEMALKIEDG